jgi:hypothetical protein
VSKYKNPLAEFAYQQGRLDVLHELIELGEQAEDKCDELGITDRWQSDSVEMEMVTKFIDKERAEAELARTIASNKL